MPTHHCLPVALPGNFAAVVQGRQTTLACEVAPRAYNNPILPQDYCSIWTDLRTTRGGPLSPQGGQRRVTPRFNEWMQVERAVPTRAGSRWVERVGTARFARIMLLLCRVCAPLPT